MFENSYFTNDAFLVWWDLLSQFCRKFLESLQWKKNCENPFRIDKVIDRTWCTTFQGHSVDELEGKVGVESTLVKSYGKMRLNKVLGDYKSGFL